jgi:glycosyltransferase involved in cell wall biosynthesis
VSDVHVVVPDGIDDPGRASGGSTYDRQLCHGLAKLGWSVHEHAVAGFWQTPDPSALAGLAGVVERIPAGALVLLDGLLASTAPEVLVPQADRLRLIALVHMPLGRRPTGDSVRLDEAAVLSAAAQVITTSAWTQGVLRELYALPADRLHVAKPGVVPAALGSGTAAGAGLLCVAAVTFDKGHDVLLAALDTISDVDWSCVCVGSLDRDPVFAADIRGRAPAERVSFPGPLTGPELGRSYAGADLLVLPSRAETYGMVVTEALARGVPVIAADVGGVTEALGYGANGVRPGLLVAPGDPAALSAALRVWLGDAALRERLRRAARERRTSLATWARTASVVAEVLHRAAR